MAAAPLSYWLGFHGLLLALLAIELITARFRIARLAPEARSRRQHGHALFATVLWVAAALATGLFVFGEYGGTGATQFFAAYAIEEALSVDNLFVFLLLFQVFRVPETNQPKVLFWGVLGAIAMRGAFIAGGLGLLARFRSISFIFAAILLFAAIRLVLPEKPEGPTRAPAWIRWITRIHPVSERQDRFFTVEGGHRMLTMLALCLIAIEVTDVVFALDSIPAVLSITRDPFLAYTSNILAVMGLRSLFFLLARALKQLRYLHFGLATVLAFAAVKMLVQPWFEVGPLPSLAVVVAVLGATVALSLAMPRRPEGPASAAGA